MKSKNGKRQKLRKRRPARSKRKADLEDCIHTQKMAAALGKKEDWKESSRADM